MSQKLSPDLVKLLYQVAFSVLNSCIGVEACPEVVQYFFVFEIFLVPCREFPREQDVSAMTFRQKKFGTFRHLFHAETSRIILVLFLVFVFGFLQTS